MKTWPLFQVDAFASRPFAGNPAAVVLLDGPREAEWMQKVAQELNLSETAFLFPVGDAWSLRWFTPGVEVALCGHATVASAHVLWETGRLKSGAVARFDTKSGRLLATKEGDLVVLDFPADPVTQVDPPAGLLNALGGEPTWIGRGRFDYLLLFADETAIRSLNPDFTALLSVKARGVIATAPGDGTRAHFVSRFFAPAAGVNEDPVTGSAHCSLASFWHERTGQSKFNALQLSKRGGEIRVEWAGERVKLGGKAVTVFTAELKDFSS